MINGRNHKLRLFADDLFIYMSNPTIAFSSILKELEQLGSLNNFKVNATKAQGLNISLPLKTQQPLQVAFPFCWTQHSLDKIYELSYLPLLMSTHHSWSLFKTFLAGKNTSQ